MVVLVLLSSVWPPPSLVVGVALATVASAVGVMLRLRNDWGLTSSQLKLTPPLSKTTRSVWLPAPTATFLIVRSAQLCQPLDAAVNVPTFAPSSSRWMVLPVVAA